MEPAVESEKISAEVVESLRERAKRSRNEGVVYVILIIGIAYAVVVYFVYAAQAAGINISITGKADLVNVTADHSEWISLISGLVLRLGAVVLAVFVIQILVSLARYRFRISDSLYTRAEAVKLANGNMEALKVLMASFSDGNMDFGALPESPYLEFLKVLRDLASKSSTK